MIIVNLTGGLGNQMFQYAFGRMLAEKYNTNLKLHFTNALFNIQRSYSLNIFNISATMVTREDLQKFGIQNNRFINRIFYLLDERCGIQFNKRVVTQKYPYIFNTKYFDIKNNSYIQGYWGNEEYFKKIGNIVRKEFCLKNKLDEKNVALVKKIRGSNSVSVHVRRADYLTNKMNIPQFIGLEYYLNAIKQINKFLINPIFFIFSDDIPWCKKNFNQLSNNMHYINYNTGKNSYKDLILMSNCKHNIIANSTFSWWGSWLNTYKNKIIIKPQ